MLAVRAQSADDTAESCSSDATQAEGSTPAIDGIFCINDYAAFGVIRGLADYGIRVPDDVRVIGFDGATAGSYTTPTLSTVRPIRARYDHPPRGAARPGRRQVRRIRWHAGHARHHWIHTGSARVHCRFGKQVTLKRRNRAAIPDCRAHCPSAVRRDVRGFGMRQTVPSAPTW